MLIKAAKQLTMIKPGNDSEIDTFSAERTLMGKSFQICGPATEKLDGPIVFLRTVSLSRMLLQDD